MAEHDPNYVIYPGHKAVITSIRIDGEYIVTAAKNGELKVMNYNAYKSDIQKGPNCFIIKS